MIVSARAKYLWLGVPRSPGVLNGSIPSIVVPSSLHPVYFSQSRSTRIELKPCNLTIRNERPGIFHEEITDHRLRRVANDEEGTTALVNEISAVLRKTERIIRRFHHRSNAMHSGPLERDINGCPSGGPNPPTLRKMRPRS